VISSCDVIFDEGTIFDGNIKTMKDNLLHICQEEFAELINQVNINTNNNHKENQSTEDNSEDKDMIYRGYFDSKDSLIEIAESALDMMDTAEKFDNPYLTPNPYPTPDSSIPTSPILPASLFTATIGEEYHKDSEEAEILTTWKAAFNARCLV
jgi:hypothetical protein